MAVKTPQLSALASSMELVPSLVLHPKRARTSNVDAIVDSIKNHGFLGGVIVQTSTRHVLVGNGRVEAAKVCKLKEVPVFWIDCSDVEAEKILLVDNRCSDLASYDDAKLLQLLEELKATEGLSGTGFDDEALASLVTALHQEQKIDQVNGVDGEWVGMPEFEAYEHSYSVVLHCETEEQRDALEKSLQSHFELSFSGAGRTRSSWYPARERALLAGATLEVHESKVSDLHPKQESS